MTHVNDAYLICLDCFCEYANDAVILIDISIWMRHLHTHKNSKWLHTRKSTTHSYLICLDCFCEYANDAFILICLDCFWTRVIRRVNASFICLRHTYVCHDSFMCLSQTYERASFDAWTPRLCVCDTHMWNNMCATHTCETTYVHTCETTHAGLFSKRALQKRRDSAMCATRMCATHTCETTHVCVAHI